MMPARAVPTLYSRIGDVFAWLAIAALAGLVTRAFVGQRRMVSASGAEPVEAPLPVS